MTLPVQRLSLLKGLFTSQLAKHGTTVRSLHTESRDALAMHENSGSGLYLLQPIAATLNEIARADAGARMNPASARHCRGLLWLAARVQPAGTPVAGLASAADETERAMRTNNAANLLAPTERIAASENLMMVERLRPMLAFLTKLDPKVTVHHELGQCLRVMLLLWAVGADLARVAPTVPGAGGYAPTTATRTGSSPIADLTLEILHLLRS